MKLWSSQLWTQFLQPVTSRLRCNALTNWAMKPLTLGAGHLWVQTPLKSWIFQASLRNCKNCVHNCEDHSFSWFHIRSSYMIHFIYHFIIVSFLMGPLEPTNDQLPTSVASYLSWLERRTGIVRSRVQTPLKSWIFQASLRNCKNCVHNCEDHSFTWFHIRSSYMIHFIYHFINNLYLTIFVLSSSTELHSVSSYMMGELAIEIIIQIDCIWLQCNKLFNVYIIWLYAAL